MQGQKFLQLNPSTYIILHGQTEQSYKWEKLPIHCQSLIAPKIEKNVLIIGEYKSLQ